MRVFPLMGVSVFGRWAILRKIYSSVIFQPSAVPTPMYCWTALMPHVAIQLVLYSTAMR